MRDWPDIAVPGTVPLGDLPGRVEEGWPEGVTTAPLNGTRPPNGTPTPTPTRRLVLTPASAFKPARVKWGWARRMPVGELTLIPGREGVGKSLLLAWMAAQLTRGTLPGEFEGQPRAVLYSASEDSWKYTISPRLIAAGADLSLVHRVTVETADADIGIGRLILPMDCRLIPETAKEVNAAALMLDPIVSLVDEKLSVNQSRELRRALEPLRAAAEEAEIVVPALVHFNKATDVDVLSKIPGGRAWAEVARAAFAVADDKDAGTYVASQIKNNLGRLDLPHLTYEIDEVFIDTDDGQASVGRLRWTGETDISVGEVLERRPDHKRDSKAEEIADWVNAQPMLVSVGEVANALRHIGYDTVKKSLARLAKNDKITNPQRGMYGPLGRGQ